MMPSSVAMFFMMDQLSQLRPAEDNRVMGQHSTYSPQRVETWGGHQASEAAIPPTCPNPQDLRVPGLQGAAITAQLLQEGCSQGTGES